MTPAHGPLDPLDAPDPSEDLPIEAVQMRLAADRRLAELNEALEARVHARTQELVAARAAAERRARHAAFLSRLTFDLALDADVSAVLRHAAPELLTLLEADAVGYLVDTDAGTHVEWARDRGLPTSIEPALLDAFLPTSARAAAGFDAALFVDDLAAGRGRLAPRALVAAGLCGVARVPLHRTTLDPVPAALAVFRFGHARPFDADTRALLESAARTLGLAADRADNLRELKATAAHARAAADIAALLDDDTLAPDAMAQRALEVIGSVADIDWAAVLVCSGTLVYGRPVRGAGGLPPLEAALASGTSAEEGALRVVVTARAPLLIDTWFGGAGPEEPGHDPISASGARSIAVVPIDRERYFCAIRHGRPRPWSPRDQELFEAAARSVRAATQRLDTRNLLERAALTDVLTGLRNRRAFDADLTTELASAGRHRFPVSLLMVDVDGLKAVNDGLGHEAGDALLRAAARALESAFRTSDRVYRLGGDEFAVLLGHAGHEAQEAITARADMAAAALRAVFPQSDLSVGLATYPACATDETGLRQVADARMYAAKAAHKAARAR
jgi:diguanylate cyclase (GGDEF)-like protein